MMHLGDISFQNDPYKYKSILFKIHCNTRFGELLSMTDISSSIEKSGRLKKLYQKLLNHKGFTVDINLREIDIKYAVSTTLKETIIHTDKLTFEKFISISRTYESIEGFFGAWVDKGLCYFDITIDVSNLKSALEIAKKFNQISIWDGINKRNVCVK